MNINVELNDQQKKTAKQISENIIGTGRFSGKPKMEDVDLFSTAFVVMMDLYERAKVDVELGEMEQMYYKLNPLES